MQNQAEKIDFEIRTYTFIRKAKLEVLEAIEINFRKIMLV